ncbi:L-asparagine oxygenase (plasmid) [Vibrio sp. THAF191c]|nr:L-asparagine oxygenase [Vibrio sp. THAF64]QGM37649.1 L-asparagine oxygenase [Vibrio sp. THAF191d]QGN73370.1 L-asparagine oxygenase [Vibrio sp. THAF191c]
MGDNGVVYCRYDKENTTPLTESAAAALVMLEAQLANESLERHQVYQPGDLLMIKNQRVVHSREEFYPCQDGADRWLVRLFGMSSLDQIVPHGNSKHIGKD